MIASASVRLALGALLLALSACTSKGHVSELKIDQSRNVVTIENDNTIRWNGVAVTLEDLKPAFERSAAMDPEPSLSFEPNFAASYELTADVLRLMKEAGITKFEFVGNEKLPIEGKPAT